VIAVVAEHVITPHEFLQEWN